MIAFEISIGLFLSGLSASGIVGFVGGVFIASLLRAGKEYDNDIERDFKEHINS